MEVVVLTRKETGDDGTFGNIVYKGITFQTGELSWNGGDDNPDVSCIPPGDYVCVESYSPHLSPRFDNMLLYLLQNVKNRSSIRIHPANWMGAVAKDKKCELEGCIALGYKTGPVDPYPNQKALISSDSAVVTFMHLLGNQPFTLRIVNAFPAVTFVPTPQVC